MIFDTKKLRGNYVYLELLEEKHKAVLQHLANNPQIWEYTQGILINQDYEKNFDAYFAMAMDKTAMGGQQAFVIRQTASDAIIGMTRFYDINPEHKKMAIGYTWYIPAIWGLPHNKECKLLLLQYAFETCGCSRIEFHVAGQNTRSQKAVTKIGGVKEGLLRKHSYRHGQPRDMIMFSIIDDEWPATKEKIVRFCLAG